MEPALLARLAGIDNVVAVKQATTDLDQARAIVEDGRLALYAGNDDLLRAVRRDRRRAAASASPRTSAGEEMLELQKAIDAGDLDRARAIEAELAPLLRRRCP